MTQLSSVSGSDSDISQELTQSRVNPFPASLTLHKFCLHASANIKARLSSITHADSNKVRSTPYTVVTHWILDSNGRLSVPRRGAGIDTRLACARWVRNVEIVQPASTVHGTYVCVCMCVCVCVCVCVCGIVRN